MLSIRAAMAILFAWRQTVVSYGISAAVHAAVLVGLGMLVFNGGQRVDAVTNLDAEFRATSKQSEPLQFAQQSAVAVDVVHSASLVHGSGGGWGGGNSSAIGAPAGLGLALKDLGGGQRASFGLPGATETQLRELGTKDNGQGASFFGTTASGEDFVFVVDISGSMSEGGRFRRAKAELKRSLDGLASSQRFYIIFFNNDAIPLPGPGLVNATAQNARDAMRWVNSIQPDGDTYPLSALMMALRLEPDAIFLLSDGQFDPEVVYLVSQERTGDPIPIHTIALVSRIGEPVMRALSKVTGGSFRFVH
ncbi:MAG TPA: VWA domain-containing protein [Pirellulales bacterium]|nr:VWA domain-containing protein [Pirellulales bacterium]